MNKILLASHGYLAQGMKSSLEILMGTNDRIECLCAYVDDDSRDVAALIDAWMETRDPADSWFVVTDIFGGSVNNEFIQRQTAESFTLIAGMNLPLLVDERAGLVGQETHDAAHDGRRIGQGEAAELRGGHVGLLAAGAAAHHGCQI